VFSCAPGIVLRTKCEENNFIFGTHNIQFIRPREMVYRKALINAVEFFLFFLSFLPEHGSLQLRRGCPSNVYQRFVVGGA